MVACTIARTVHVECGAYVIEGCMAYQILSGHALERGNWEWRAELATTNVRLSAGCGP